MISLYFKSVALLLLIFSVVAVFIHAQPYDDSELRSFLVSPDSCPAPCFMGIRPRVTTAEAAVAILEAHEWVAHVDTTSISWETRHGTILWAWSGRQPSFIDSQVQGKLNVSDLILGDVTASSETNNLVEAIILKTRVGFGDTLLTFGKGQGNERTQPPRHYNSAMINVYYPDLGLGASAITSCPVSLKQYWGEPLLFVWGSVVISGLAYVCPQG